MTTLPDGRIEMVCRDCGFAFPALGEWQTRCRTCYATFKAGKAPEQETEALHRALRAAETENATLRRQLADLAADRDRWRLKAMSKPTRAPATARIPKDCWRRLVQLAHPDRHGGSDAANEATRWLLENRP